ncbi:DNA mismatch repair protein Msh6-1 [Hordeum vulgare]|nr:DNA mismatch repair protein Msh6-1 [Hordeum vulgare]
MEPPPASFVAPAAPARVLLPPPVAPPPQLRPSALSVASAAPPAATLAPPASAVAPAVGVKRRRAGQYVVLPQPVPDVAPVAAAPKVRKKPSLGSKGAATPKVKKTTSRKKPTAAPSPAPPPVVHEVLDGMPAPSMSFMGLLEEAEVDIGAPPLEPFGFGDDLQEEDDEEEEGEDEEEVTEIEEEAFAAVGKPTVRSTNYSEAEDILLEAIADLRYKEMAALKGKAFPFKHVWKILQTYDKWKLRDQETAPKKSAMLRMDHSEEEGRNEHKPAENKKDKLRKKMEG